MTVNTKIQLCQDMGETIQTDLLVVPLFKEELGKKKKDTRISNIIKPLGKSLIEAASRECFKANPGQRLLFNSGEKLPAARVLFMGLGENNEGAVAAFREGVGEAARMARNSGDATLTILTRDINDLTETSIAATAAEAALLGSYRFDHLISETKDNPKRPPLKTVTIATQNPNKTSSKDIKIAVAIAEATNMARDMVNEPAGTMTPEILANFAKKLSRQNGLKCTVKGAPEIERQRMGMFRAVSLGADTEPKFITIEYQPKKKTTSKGIALVGKGITFDSGGYNLKPSEGMAMMKMDMGGAATTIATMHAVAAIAPPFPVTCYVGACENLVSGRAYKPGDVLTSRQGTTVEINNTDAEGRLILGDLLDYACEKGYEAIIDVATLTGACMVALGPYTYGAFSSDDDLASEILNAASSAGEDVWRLPLTSDLKEQLKSDIADTKNTGERMGGAITAALFLSGFVDETPWAHLDIAGPAMYGRDKGVNPKGASGVGVRTLARLIYLRQNSGMKSTNTV